MVRVGVVYGGTQDEVLIVSNQKVPELNKGDYVYVEVSPGVFMVLSIEESRSQSGESLRAYAASLGITLPSQMIIVSSPVCTYKARPVFLVDTRAGIVEEPRRPPPVNSEAYSFDESDPKSVKIMEALSRYAARGTPQHVLGYLRAGHRAFLKAPLKVDFPSLVRQHILVSGQTGSGKTTSVVNWLAWYLANVIQGVGEDMSWLIIDRHGEYLRHLSRVFQGCPAAFDRVHAFKAATGANERRVLASLLDSLSKDALDRVRIMRPPTYTIAPEYLAVVAGFPASVADALQHLLSLLEDRLPELLGAIGLGELPLYPEEGVGVGDWVGACIWYLASVLPYEGREKGDFYGWLYPELAGRYGVYKNALRQLLVRLLEVFGLRVRRQRFGEIRYYVVDDRTSMFRVSPLFSKPEYAVRLTLAALDRFSANRPIRSSLFSGSSPELPECDPERLRAELMEYCRERLIDSIIELLEAESGGNIVILDLAAVPLDQADLLVMSLLSEILYRRMSEGKAPEEYRTIAIVSEEAPLYLSPEKVRSAHNVFARIAREGRKFGIGLIAVTQQASLIERSIRTNFNTCIALRTRDRAELTCLDSLGISADDLPYLANFEAFVITNTGLNVPFALPISFLPIDRLHQVISESLGSAAPRLDEFRPKYSLEELLPASREQERRGL